MRLVVCAHGVGGGLLGCRQMEAINVWWLERVHLMEAMGVWWVEAWLEVCEWVGKGVEGWWS